MAQTYDRRINLYINGKEVQNTLAGIQKEMYKSTNELRRMTIGTDEYNRKAGEVKKLKQIYADHQAQLRATISPLQKLTEFAKQILPAFSFAAIATGAKKAFDQVIASTDTLSTQWDVFMGGMKQATNEFFRTIGTGDWSSFLTNMNEAIRVGREYQKTLDDIQEKDRALRIIEAEAQQNILDLEIKLRSKGLSKDDRIAAADEIIKIEKDLAKQRVDLATQTFENILSTTMQESRLTKEQLMGVMRDYDSMDKQQAKKYLEKQAELKKLIDDATSEASQTGIAAKETPQIKQLRTELAAFPETFRLYSDAIKGQGKTTDEQLDKTTQAWIDLLAAQRSATENTSMVQIRRANLIARSEKADETSGKKTAAEEKKKIEQANKAQLEALDQAFTASQNLLRQQYLKKETDEKEFQARMITSELAYLELKKQMLTQQGENTVDVESQIWDKRIELAKINEETLKKLHKDFAEEVAAYMDAENDKLDDDVKNANDYGKKVFDEQKRLKDDEKKLLEERAQNYLSLAQGIGESFEEMLMNQEISFAQFLKNTLMLALDALEKMMVMSIAEATIAGIVKSGWDFTALARAFAKIVAIKAAFGTAKALVMGGSKVEKKAAGGFTKGAKMYIAGEAGTEWIAPNSMVKHPATRPIIAALENMRTSRLSPAAIKTFATGGYSRQSTSISGNNLTDFNFSNTSSIAPLLAATTKALDENAKATREFMKWKPKVYTELIKKDLDTLENIQKKRGL